MCSKTLRIRFPMNKLVWEKKTADICKLLKRITKKIPVNLFYRRSIFLQYVFIKILQECMLCRMMLLDGNPARVTVQENHPQCQKVCRWSRPEENFWLNVSFDADSIASTHFFFVYYLKVLTTLFSLGFSFNSLDSTRRFFAHKYVCVWCNEKKETHDSLWS